MNTCLNQCSCSPATFKNIFLQFSRQLRGHVNKKCSPKIQKDFGSGWVGQVSNWKFKKIGKYICIHYFITFLDEHSNVNNVKNALLCLCSCFYVQVFVVNYFYIYKAPKSMCSPSNIHRGLRRSKVTLGDTSVRDGRIG